MGDSHAFHLKLTSGEDVPVEVCRCGECDNEFFVPAHSDEWHPTFCCYCGIRFIRKTTGDEPDDFTPFWWHPDNIPKDHPHD